MKTSNIMDCERRKIEKLIKFQLPNRFINIGFILFLIGFISFVLLKITGLSGEMSKLVLRGVILISLLLISISKDKEEDEMIKLIRIESYSLAFVIGVIYALIQPGVNYIIGLIISTEKSIYSNLGDFQVLIFMLMIQLSSFYFLKRNR